MPKQKLKKHDFLCEIHFFLKLSTTQDSFGYRHTKTVKCQPGTRNQRNLSRTEIPGQAQN